MGRSGIAFTLLLVLAVGTMAAYVLQYQGAEDEELTTEEARESAVEGAGKGDAQKKLEQDIERTKHLQAERKRIMDEMVEGGIAERIENPAGEPFVYVLEPFFGLSFEEQASLMNVVWSYYITEDRSADTVTIFDDATGKEIGSYSKSGLKIGGE